MRLIALFALLFAIATGDGSFADFQQANKGTVDYSSLTMCWILGAARVEAVDGNPERGYQCKVSFETWTEDAKQAKELCESRIPYYITAASPMQNDVGTSCTFQINLECETSHWQIHGKCYKVTDAVYTWDHAAGLCSRQNTADKSQIAVYSSKRFTMYFDQMVGIYDAWVKIPHIRDYFDNGDGEAAVYVQDGAFKYDLRKGDIMMDEETAEHQVLCEYTPPMTMAEMYYLAKVYSEIYPFEVYEGGAIIPTSSYMTIKQLDFVENNSGWNDHYFTTKHFDETCMSLGRIFNVKSYPMTAIEDEFKEVKQYLNNHRFYLTSAYKNNTADDGCVLANYKQPHQDGTIVQLYRNEDVSKAVCDASSFCFNKENRYPTMAAMRAPLLCALHTFNYVFTDCPQEQGNVAIEFIRDDGRKLCHYVNNEVTYSLRNAIRECEKIGSSLSGFDSQQEFEAVNKHVKPVKNSCKDHYWLGGVSPCKQMCYAGRNSFYIASWNIGVAKNTTFLNYFNHKPTDWIWAEGKKTQIVTFRKDITAFHLHFENGKYAEMFSICGKTAPLKPSGRKRGGVLAPK
ncbi:unnamed protein product [Caenorhabditis brenneri]